MFYSSALQPSSENNALDHNICETTAAATVVWNKLNDIYLWAFLEKCYILEDSTIWKIYLDKLALEEIRKNPDLGYGGWNYSWKRWMKIIREHRI
jgi:hypothetical protein